MRNLRNIAILLMVLLISAGTLFAGGSSAGGNGQPVTAYNLPRNETLYFNGLQWGAPRGNNVYGNTNNALNGGHRQLQYETPFTFNLLDGKL
jgi:peptide/nickel transport system substrate-binding protein